MTDNERVILEPSEKELECERLAKVYKDTANRYRAMSKDYEERAFLHMMARTRPEKYLEILNKVKKEKGL